MNSQQIGLLQLWVGLVSSKYYHDIPVHEVYSQLDPQKSLALPLFHALSGCDTTSQILGCGKKTAWAIWSAMPELTDTFLSSTSDPDSFTLESEYMKLNERFTVLMYNKSCSAATVNEACLLLFSHGLRGLDAIPPTQAALLEHVKRSLIQASFIWKQATKAQQTIPPFDKWGWELDPDKNQWMPFWTTLADASKACALLLYCGCTKRHAMELQVLSCRSSVYNTVWL